MRRIIRSLTTVARRSAPARLRFATATALFCALLGCSSQPASTHIPVQPRYLANRGADTIVVFFHGIFGDPTETWRAAGAAESFADLIATDTALGKPDVYLVGYASPLFGKALNIEDNAEKIRTDLFDQGVFKRRNIIFVKHSMGGVVARRVITKLRGGERESLARIKGVLLFGVPVHGSTVAEKAY